MEKNKFIIFFGKELDFYKVLKLIFIMFCVAFFSTIIMYMYGLLAQLMYPGMIEIWVGTICISTMFGFALSSFAVAREQDKIKNEIDILKQDFADIKSKK
ncbi:MAG TPA: hypothetical protein VMX17_14570 [Candidatus Glassbacteria bacterium]|nr:hypothetical protein [Candidatus Glassbacteria bacterium]